MSIAEDNFISSEKNIDDISEVTADNYSVTEIQTQNYLNLAQDKFIFYSKEN